MPWRRYPTFFLVLRLTLIAFASASFLLAGLLMAPARPDLAVLAMGMAGMALAALIRLVVDYDRREPPRHP